MSNHIIYTYSMYSIKEQFCDCDYVAEKVPKEMLSVANVLPYY